MTRTDRMSELLTVTERLVACIEREVELLRAMRPQDLAALQREKTALADAYEGHLRALRAVAAAEAADADDPALCDRLLRATERFRGALAENARTLKAAEAANDRVLRAIVDAVEQRRGRPAAYTATGASPRAAGPAAAATPVSMALDRRL